MLLIISSYFDYSTNVVIEWLIQKKVPFQRWNGESSCASVTIEIGREGELSIEMETTNSRFFSLGIVSKYWYRRGDFQIFRPVLKNHKRFVANILQQEWMKLKDFLLSVLQEKPHLGDLSKEKYHNKLISLLLASKAGLTVPDTLITTEKENIVKSTENRTAITKAIDNLFSFTSKARIHAVGTEVVKLEEVEVLNDRFFPTLIQEKIEKAFELRIFFLKHAFYSMAIFSQLDDQTSVDFRNYNREKPNRCVPYTLPENVESKLIRYVELMALDTGSIDMIVTPDGDYVFLEVNHIGQFGWLSEACNYYIEEKIADYLSKL